MKRKIKDNNEYIGMEFESIDVHGIPCGGVCTAEYTNIIILNDEYVVHKKTLNQKHKSVQHGYGRGEYTFDLDKSQTIKKFPCDFKYNGHHMSPKYGEVHSVVR